MHIIKSIVEDGPMLYQLEFEVPNGLEFEQVSWRSVGIPGGQDENSKWLLRYVNNGQNSFDHLPVLSKFIKSLQYAQEILLVKLWESPVFQQNWANVNNIDQMKANISPYYELCKDLPGFATGIHVDTRTCVTAGMVFFNKSEIKEKSTVFYSTKASDFPKIMPCAPGQGWYSANWADSWHSGGNSSNDVRYSIKFGYGLKMGNLA